jgi:predicted nuclease of predicted toxin-antitoxin system
VKLYLDEDLSPRVAVLLRQRGLDAVSAHEVGHGGRLDLDQLRGATREGRCLVTRNVADFAEIVRDLVNRQEAHAGIMLVPASFRGNEFAILAEAIVQQAQAHPDGLADQVLFLRRPPPG